jgi:hypothetical protein
VPSIRQHQISAIFKPFSGIDPVEIPAECSNHSQVNADAKRIGWAPALFGVIRIEAHRGVLKEHDSAVSQALKEVFLALRQAAKGAD